MPVSFSFNTAMGTVSKTDESQHSPRTVSTQNTLRLSRFHPFNKLDSHSSNAALNSSTKSKATLSSVTPMPYRRFSDFHSSTLVSHHSPNPPSPSIPSPPPNNSPSSTYNKRFTTALNRATLPSPLPKTSSRSSHLVTPSPFRPPVTAANRLANWSSPFAVKQRRLLETSLSPTLVDSAFRVVHDSLAPGTRSTYAAGILRFTQFCDSWHISEDARMPASATLLAAFVAQCRGLYAGNTVRSWLSGIRSWHIYHQADWHGDHDWVQQARTTANKEGTTFKRPLRAPVSLEHLRALKTHLDLSLPLHAAIWATALVTFFGCRRLGETTVRSLSSFNPLYNVLRSTEPGLGHYKNLAF